MPRSKHRRKGKDRNHTQAPTTSGPKHSGHFTRQFYDPGRNPQPRSHGVEVEKKTYTTRRGRRGG
jgi:hypothetical protein